MLKEGAENSWLCLPRTKEVFGNVTLTPKAQGVQTTLEQDGRREKVW